LFITVHFAAVRDRFELRHPEADAVRLADFIVENIEGILAEWESFAHSLASGSAMDVIALRDHAEAILRVTARDMIAAQTPRQQSDKSKGMGGTKRPD
jgi:hypothetical protein